MSFRRRHFYPLFMNVKGLWSYEHFLRLLDWQGYELDI